MRDHDRVVAGASCIIWGGRSQAHVVWVDQTLRHRGLGPRLVAEAEHAARRRRDRMAMDLAYDVLTGDDYEHLGFRTVATIENCPTRTTTRWYCKDL